MQDAAPISPYVTDQGGLVRPVGRPPLGRYDEPRLNIEAILDQEIVSDVGQYPALLPANPIAILYDHGHVCIARCRGVPSPAASKQHDVNETVAVVIANELDELRTKGWIEVAATSQTQ
mgnify:CR=1 FL=1